MGDKLFIVVRGGVVDDVVLFDSETLKTKYVNFDVLDMDCDEDNAHQQELENIYESVMEKELND